MHGLLFTEAERLVKNSNFTPLIAEKSNVATRYRFARQRREIYELLNITFLHSAISNLCVCAGIN